MAFGSSTPSYMQGELYAIKEKKMPFRIPIRHLRNMATLCEDIPVFTLYDIMTPEES